jgi:hypothetical protein
VYVDLGAPGHLIDLTEKPSLQRFGVPRHADHLPGQRLAVHTGGAHVDHEQRPAEPLGYPGRVGQRIAAGRRAVVARNDGVLEPERGRDRFGVDVPPALRRRPLPPLLAAFWLPPP